MNTTRLKILRPEQQTRKPSLREFSGRSDNGHSGTINTDKNQFS